MLNLRLPFFAPDVIISTLFGVGRAPLAPGTAASLVALGIGAGVIALGGTAALLILIALTAPVAVWASGETMRRLKSPDPSAIVIDEAVGQWIALAAAPFTPLGVLLAFLFFRLFDIAKPWPVSWADRVAPGGIGILLDDVLAGLYAAAVLLLAGEAALI